MAVGVLVAVRVLTAGGPTAVHFAVAAGSVAACGGGVVHAVGRLPGLRDGPRRGPLRCPGCHCRRTVGWPPSPRWASTAARWARRELPRCLAGLEIRGVDRPAWAGVERSMAPLGLGGRPPQRGGDRGGGGQGQRVPVGDAERNSISGSPGGAWCWPSSPGRRRPWPASAGTNGLLSGAADGALDVAGGPTATRRRRRRRRLPATTDGRPIVGRWPATSCGSPSPSTPAACAAGVDRGRGPSATRRHRGADAAGVDAALPGRRPGRVPAAQPRPDRRGGPGAGRPERHPFPARTPGLGERAGLVPGRVRAAGHGRGVGRGASSTGPGIGASGCRRGPPSRSRANWIEPLLLDTSGTRTITMIMEPVDPATSRRHLSKESVGLEAIDRHAGTQTVPGARRAAPGPGRPGPPRGRDHLRVRRVPLPGPDRHLRRAPPTSSTS